MDRMWRSPQLASQVSRLSPLDYCVWGWMKELVYSVKVVMQDALLGRILDAADCIRNSQRSCNELLAQFTTERQPLLRLAVAAFSKTSFKHRSIQIKGNFMKLTLHLYFKLLRIMLVYYFVLFIVNNRYLLF